MDVTVVCIIEQLRLEEERCEEAEARVKELEKQVLAFPFLSQYVFAICIKILYSEHSGVPECTSCSQLYATSRDNDIIGT